MVYSECAPGCPKICKNLDMKCSTKCIAGCTCPQGQYHDGQKCVDRDQCSCYYHERRYNHGESRYEPCQVWWVKPLFLLFIFLFYKGFPQVWKWSGLKYSSKLRKYRELCFDSAKIDSRSFSTGRFVVVFQTMWWYSWEFFLSNFK